MVNWTKTKKYNRLKTGLKDNLASRGLVEPAYEDMLQRYMDLWVEYQQLTEDIDQRGVVVKDEKRGMLVENRSVTIRHQTSNKMLDIWGALGFDDLDAAVVRDLDDAL